MDAPTVCVVGSVNLDLVVTGSRLPTPGETVTGGVFDRHPGGKGANQALTARRQGADVVLLAGVGQDPFADEALALLRRDLVDLSHVVTLEDEPTGVALIVVSDVGENQIAVAPGANASLGASTIETAGFDAVVCQLEVPDAVVLAAMRKATGLVCLNAAPARPVPDEVLSRCDVIIVNEIEHDALHEQLGDFGGLLVVTRGADGARVFRNGQLVATSASPVVDVLDTVGAGDAFCATFVVELAKGAGLDVALLRACVAGAVTATRAGAQPSLPTTSDVDDFLARTAFGGDG